MDGRSTCHVDMDGPLQACFTVEAPAFSCVGAGIQVLLHFAEQ